MSEARKEFGFERTVCDCIACTINCHFISGYLIPSDLQRMADHLGYSDLVTFALDNLLASPGATVIENGRIRQIRTLVTARCEDGACLFLDERNRCRLHSVSQYGCAFFDMHQSKEEADRRSGTGLYQIDLAWKSNHLYAQLWLLLKTLGRVAPSPIEVRARMQAALRTRGNSASPPAKTNNR